MLLGNEALLNRRAKQEKSYGNRWRSAYSRTSYLHALLYCFSSIRSKRMGFYKETIFHANNVTFEAAAFLTPRRKAHCKEVATFAIVSNLVHGLVGKTPKFVYFSGNVISMHIGYSTVDQERLCARKLP